MGTAELNVKGREAEVSWNTNARGEAVREVCWPAEGAKTALVIHHGLGEHIGRYTSVVEALGDLPLTIWGYDARGHGESDGKRGHADGLDQLADDLHTNLARVREQTGVESVILMGHSMGAATVLWLTSRGALPDWVSAVVVSAPPVVLDLNLAARVKVRVGRVLSMLAPAVTVGSELDPSGISSVADEVRRYQHDALIHDQVSLALGRSLVEDAPTVLQRLGSCSKPLLVLHGADDPIALCSGSKELSRLLPESELHIFEGARHEIHHETSEIRTALFDALRGFVSGHLSGSEA